MARTAVSKTADGSSTLSSPAKQPVNVDYIRVSYISRECYEALFDLYDYLRPLVWFAFKGREPIFR